MYGGGVQRQKWKGWTGTLLQCIIAFRETKANPDGAELLPCQ
jgi:hypothetical protein